MGLAKEERHVLITAGGVTVEAELNDSETAKAIWDALPIKGRVNTWGEEIYFYIQLTLQPESPQELVAMGDVAYWPDGPALCIFFGPTPASRGDEIRPASPVNVFGTVLGDPTTLRQVHDGAEITFTKKE
ncbi:MAG: cyclophilin-like fold protein [Bacillota bacterium]